MCGISSNILCGSPIDNYIMSSNVGKANARCGYFTAEILCERWWFRASFPCSCTTNMFIKKVYPQQWFLARQNNWWDFHAVPSLLDGKKPHHRQVGCGCWPWIFPAFFSRALGSENPVVGGVVKVEVVKPAEKVMTVMSPEIFCGWKCRIFEDVQQIW